MDSVAKLDLIAGLEEAARKDLMACEEEANLVVELIARIAFAVADELREGEDKE